MGATPNHATTTWKTKIHMLKIQNLRLLSFHCIIFSNYSSVKCIIIIFVLINYTRKFLIWVDHGESINEE
jgi:type IV secretory pathway component VirB8